MTVESGFRFLLPPEKSFRFCEFSAYRSRLNKASISEMDFGYWDEHHKVLRLLELKDQSVQHGKGGEPAAKLSADDYKAEIAKLKGQIKDNVKDVLVMLNAAWRQIGDGKALVGELPEPCRVCVPVQMFFVLKRRASEKGQAPPEGYAQAADSAARGYGNLLGVSATAVVIDQWKALALKLPLADASADTDGP